MKLYRCKTPTDRLCACGRAARELTAQGIKYEQERGPGIPVAQESRPIELTGQPSVPVLVTDSGEAIHDSKRIIEHLRNRSV